MNKKITVLHVCEHFGGKEASLHGVAKAFQWWIPLFDKTKFNIFLCSRKGFDKAANQMKESGIDVLYLGYGKMDPRNLINLLKILKEKKVDIIHAHGFGACMWSRIAGHILKIPTIIHGRANYGKIPFTMYFIERLLGPFTKYALAVSKSTANFTVKKRFVPEKNVQTLYSGILLDNVKAVDETWKTNFKKQQNALNKKIIGIVGRLVSHKGHIDSFIAFKKLREDFPDTELWVIGDGDFEIVLKKWVQENEYEEYIKFLGYQKEVIKIIQCFDIQLFPSHMEGTPNTLYEALAVGNAIVASKCDGQEEILEDNKDSVLFDCGDSKKITENLMKVLKDLDFQKKIKTNALNKSKSFDGKNFIKFLETYYEEIMKKEYYEKE